MNLNTSGGVLEGYDGDSATIEKYIGKIEVYIEKIFAEK
jgi:hypothetical protein